MRDEEHLRDNRDRLPKSQYRVGGRRQGQVTGVSQQERKVNKSIPLGRDGATNVQVIPGPRLEGRVQKDIQKQGRGGKIERRRIGQGLCVGM